MEEQNQKQPTQQQSVLQSEEHRKGKINFSQAFSKLSKYSKRFFIVCELLLAIVVILYLMYEYTPSWSGWVEFVLLSYFLFIVNIIYLIAIIIFLLTHKNYNGLCVW
ncbi:MAG: hypothetical protein ACNFW9_05720 [Candidatus Kerfeldbacteria bacterium]|jgi:hypothetical protein